MDAIAAAEEQILTEKVRQKLKEISTAAEAQLGPMQDHVNFTLQQARFKCAYECFDRSKKQDEINNCVENCSMPVYEAQNLIESEMAQFQERMNRALMVCHDKFESAQFQKNRLDSLKDLESCIGQTVQDGINSLPPYVAKLKRSLRILD